MSPRTLGIELERLTDDSEAVRRDQPVPLAAPPFCVVSAVPPVSGLAGTLWLDTGTVGPLGSHPLWVRLFDGSFTHVAWLVLDDQ
jgi:hypothetical protein